MDICKKSFGFLHKSGVFMHISSLPNRYGIGSLGRAAYEFADLLDRSGQTCWQVLPLNPTAYGDSPYQSPASVAGNPYFIDLDILKEKGLLTAEELEPEVCAPGPVNYERLFHLRYRTLRTAYSRFVPDRAFTAFCRNNNDWLGDYGLFMALKEHYNHRAWTSWEPCHRNVESARTLADNFASECGFWKWVQFEFMCQWNALHDYVASKGIRMIGDMPIYVAHDSLDVWRTPDQFLLDENCNPTLVAGCPPDAYSATGQRWGNPIYNWEKMEQEGFSWWIARVKRAFALFDLLRVDHFRGFSGFYAIPAESENGMAGEWRTAPGKQLFDTIKKFCPGKKIIAEDLGMITPDVRELLAYTGFPGMKVLQFAFYDDNSEYLPRCYTTDNCIVYTSTHDSDCTKSWFSSLDEQARIRFHKAYRRRGTQTATSASITMAMLSRANLSMICMQDYLELSNEEGRMNIPSKPDGNWTWRVDPGYDTPKLRRKIRNHTKRGNRLK